MYVLQCPYVYDTDVDIVDRRCLDFVNFNVLMYLYLQSDSKYMHYAYSWVVWIRAKRDGGLTSVFFPAENAIPQLEKAWGGCGMPEHDGNKAQPLPFVVSRRHDVHLSISSI